MAKVLSEEEISTLLAEKKALPADWRRQLRLHTKANRAFKQRDLPVVGAGGSRFRIILRQSELNRFDFSIILTFTDDADIESILLRFNGRHPSGHTNRYEKRKGLKNASFRNQFHVHRATERYQLEGFPIDGYAEVTNAYNSFETALDYFVSTNGLVDPSEKMPLFPSE